MLSQKWTQRGFEEVVTQNEKGEDINELWLNSVVGKEKIGPCVSRAANGLAEWWWKKRKMPRKTRIPPVPSTSEIGAASRHPLFGVAVELMDTKSRQRKRRGQS